MKNRKRFGGWMTVLIVLLTVFVTYAAGQEEKVLHSFNGANGSQPPAGLIFDANGNLYGTTVQGGAQNYGVVFELMPGSRGGWAEEVLHTFDNTNGTWPDAGLLFDAAGNLYGTSSYGGASDRGAVFELSPRAGGGWAESILHDFKANNLDGYEPTAGLISDAIGNLYGTTFYGGIHTAGIAFKLTRNSGGGWTQTVLHNFGCAVSNCIDGYYPQGGMILDASGNLYGTTFEGGLYGSGMVFELMPAEGGKWVEKRLHSFGSGSDGQSPYGSLVADAAGNLYGTTAQGGTYGQGTIFELSSKAGGNWGGKVLYSFGNGNDGQMPFVGLVFDGLGNLYGTTLMGGAYGLGTVFELTPNSGGSWTETLLWSFGNGTDGQLPFGGVILDSAGNLYGTTSAGGLSGNGTVFQITP